MESFEDKPSKEGFFKYVFEFNSHIKSQLLNIIQYTLLSIIPIVFINTLMQYYVPEVDDSKSIIEILIEVFFQIIFIIISLYYINRIINYIPTISKEPYQEINFTNLNLAIFFVVLSLQTKLGDKINILVHRFLQLFNVEKTTSKKKKESKQTTSQTTTQNSSQDTQEISLQNDPYSTSITSLPVANQNNQMTSPNFNKMYQNNPTPLVQANSPIENYDNNIMAANEALGGSFGSNF
jgi:hypothetical protein